jgi:predicted ABC-type transport system involved in lysophospholipase L1 biosynthesis ATPase subunit
MEQLGAYLDRQGTTLLLVTHDEELARRWANRILHMKDGKLV